MKYEGLQSRLKIIGEEGCHFLSLCYIANSYLARHGFSGIDIDDTYTRAISLGVMKSDCYVTDGERFLNAFTGAQWKREVLTKKPADSLEFRYIEEVWYNKRTGFRHYKMSTHDTLSSSVTVKEGVIEKWYVWRAV